MIPDANVILTVWSPSYQLTPIVAITQFDSGILVLLHTTTCRQHQLMRCSRSVTIPALSRRRQPDEQGSSSGCKSGSWWSTYFLMIFLLERRRSPTFAQLLD